MPDTFGALAVALVGLAPGWLAMLGWQAARGSNMAAFEHAMLTAAVLSLCWCGPLALILGPAALDAWGDGGSSSRVALWLFVIVLLFGLPYAGGYITGAVVEARRATRERITILLRDGGIVEGFEAGSTAAVVRVRDAAVTVGDATRCSARLEISRADIVAILRDTDRG
ncbi:MAG: hypothetical protein M3320_01420 [Actinomycetota bacterium]|nr:hypothetical protein [Actinomycetota bacterium]